MHHFAAGWCRHPHNHLTPSISLTSRPTVNNWPPLLMSHRRNVRAACQHHNKNNLRPDFQKNNANGFRFAHRRVTIRFPHKSLRKYRAVRRRSSQNPCRTPSRVHARRSRSFAPSFSARTPPSVQRSPIAVIVFVQPNVCVCPTTNNNCVAVVAAAAAASFAQSRRHGNGQTVVRLSRGEQRGRRRP